MVSSRRGCAGIALGSAGWLGLAGPAASGDLPDEVAAALSRALEGLPCAGIEAALAPEGRLELSGFVGSAEDAASLERALSRVGAVQTIIAQVHVRPWPSCELLEILAPYEGTGGGGALELKVPIGGGTTRLRAGEELIVEVRVPPGVRYLYLGYLQHDGRVGYITTTPVAAQAAAGEPVRLLTGYEVAEPFGEEMLVAVASERPLFIEPRPAYEPAAAYLTALRARLAEMRAADPEATIVAGHLVITTAPAAPASR